MERDIPYKAGDELTEYERSRCRLDLYLPASGAQFPTLVWFHGGGLQDGSKEVSDAFSSLFTTNGIALASVNYRLSPHATYPSHVDDAAAAVAWVIENIATRGGDAGRVFVGGHSAGGYLTSMIGAAPDLLARHGHSTDELAGCIPVSGQTVVHTTVRAERGVDDDLWLVDEAAPLYHARRDAPPFLCICGEHDNPRRCEENRRLVKALEDAGHADATFVEIPGRDHCGVLNGVGAAGDPVGEMMVEFIGRL